MAKTLREQIEAWSRWDGFPSWARREFQQALALPDTVQTEPPEMGVLSELWTLLAVDNDKSGAIALIEATQEKLNG